VFVCVFDEKGELRNVKTEIESVGDMQTLIIRRLVASRIGLLVCIVKLSRYYIVNRAMCISSPFIIVARFSVGIGEIITRTAARLPK
jgi:hypothetical protein